MKKLICMFTALLLLPVLANAEMVSVSELYEQVQELGRWQENCETPNGLITVDIPIIVPDVQAFPVLTLERAVPLSDSQMNTLLERCKRVGKELVFDPTGNGDELYILGNWGRTDKAEDRTGFSLSVGEPWKHQLEGEGTYGYALKMAEDAALSDSGCLETMNALLQDTVLAMYQEMELEFVMDYMTYDGFYDVELRQKVMGIPVYRGIMQCSLHHTGSPQTNKAFDKQRKKYNAIWDCRPEINLTYYDANNYYIRVWASKLKEVKIEDVPLASLTEVMASIRKEIEAGRVQQVHALRLGYVLYADEKENGYVWAIPSWLIECMYMHNAEDGKLSRQRAQYADEHLPFWNEWEFETIPINAQTMEWDKYTVPDDNTYLCPDVITWQEIGG